MLSSESHLEGVWTNPEMLQGLRNLGAPVDEAFAEPSLHEWWSRGIEAMSPMQRSWILHSSRNPVLRDDPWPRLAAVPWEEDLFGVEYGSMRDRFLMNCTLAGYDHDTVEAMKGRWMMGEFDSVTSSFLTIGSVFVESSRPITSSMAASAVPSFITVYQKDEIDISGERSELGRQGLPMKFLSTPNLGDLENGIIGFRDKIPGSRFVKVVEGDRTVLRGYKDISIPEDFPVELAEWYGGKFYILYPYGLPNFVWDSHSFSQHPWFAPDQYEPKPWSEGIMVLTSEGEYRVKNNFTWEMSLEDHGLPGVWEVCWARLPGKMSGIVPLRPRPGKVPSRMALSRIRANVTAVDFRRMIRNMSCPYSITTNHVGPFLGTYRKTVLNGAKMIIVDSGYRFNDHSWTRFKLVSKTVSPVLKDPAWASYVTTALVSTESTSKNSHVPNHFVSVDKLDNPSLPLESRPNWKMRIGVKVVPYDAKTEETLVISDQGKPWDEIGGNLEHGESPIVGLFREIKEELQMEMISAAQFIDLGVSDYVDEHEMEVGRTHIFMCPIFLFGDHPSLKRVNPWVGPLNADSHVDGYQKWHFRNLSHWLTRVGKPAGAAAFLKANLSRESPLRSVVGLTTSYLTAWITALNSGRVNLCLDAVYALGHFPMSMKKLELAMVVRGYSWDLTGLDSRYYRIVHSKQMGPWQKKFGIQKGEKVAVATPRGSEYVKALGLFLKYVFVNGSLEEAV